MSPPSGVDPLEEDPDPAAALLARVNPDSLVTVTGAKIEPSIAGDDPATRYQFERTGYFWRDPADGRDGALVFNRIVGLKSGYRAESRATTPDGRAERADGATSPEAAPARPKRGGPPPGSRPRISEERSRAREADEVLMDRFDRYRSQLELPEEHADLLTGTRGAGEFFEAALAEHDDPAGIAAWVVTDVRGVLEGRTLAELPFGGAALGRLAALVADGKVSRRAAKDVLGRMAEEGGEPADLVDSMGLAAVSDTAELASVVDGVLSAWPEKVEEYRAGRKQLVGLFVGEVMKATGGAADPGAVRTLLSERLDS